MSRYLNYLKQSNIQAPIWMGIALAHVPFEMRPGIGKMYSTQKHIIDKFKTIDSEQKRHFIFNQFFRVFKHAYINVPFYNKLYNDYGIHPDNICNFDDINKVPIVSKKDLISVPIEDRSYPAKNRLLVNTGGSSGKAFSFYMDPIRYGNEWAHMHDIWAAYGYKPHSLKLSFDGRSNVKNYLSYDLVRNSLKFDIYADPKLTGAKLKDVIKRYDIEYLHGYPSAIYEFAQYCRDSNEGLLEKLRQTLKAVFLSSEYPSPFYRDYIEKVFGIPTQSFYGHTETCVLAKEEEKFTYSVYQTYGYGEVFENDTGVINLIGTSYFNFASPLIRYNTEDAIEVVAEDRGVLDKFKIKEGRNGDYILDSDHKRIPLTGLIFGRHHKLFDYCSHIQIRENYPGNATVYYVPNSPIADDVQNLFDSNNIRITFEFVKLTKPILTKAGKVNLLVK